jgi:hypothetical protein
MSESEIVRVTQVERRVAGRRLGRDIVHDPRSWNFPAKAAAEVASVQHAAVGLPLDQGDVGSCTANALCGALNSVPYDAAGRQFTEGDALVLYGRETAMEGQPYPPNDVGGSGLVACKAAKDLGWISGYQHAFGIDQALKVLTVRPVVCGLTWYSSFDAPDPDGMVEIAADATPRGGHAVFACGIDKSRKLVWFWNSWGPTYGVGGRFCMAFDTWARLLAEQGDVTVPIV